MKYDNKNIKQSITEGLKKHYGIIPNFVDFKPVGEESYSYFVIDKDGEKYFVKYCEKANAIKNIDLVNQLLIQLKDFDFIVPQIGVKGITSFDVLSGKIYVYPFIEGEILTIGNEEFDKPLVDRLLEIMVEIHSSKDRITVDLPVESFDNDFLLDFEKLFALRAKSDEKKDEEASLFLESNEGVIRSLISDHTKSGEHFKNNKPIFVLTHGDITGRNIIVAEDCLKLVDWDGAMIAPAERDLNFLLDNPHFLVQEYLKKREVKNYDPKLKEYYGQQWALGSIIGNLENLLTMDLTPEGYAEYLDEAKKYLGYYQ